MDSPESLSQLFLRELGPELVEGVEGLPSELTHDECLTVPAGRPDAIVRPRNLEEVTAIVELAFRERIPLVARGGGTGLSGGANAPSGSVVVSFERMNRVIELDVANQAAVVEAGVTLAQLEQETARTGLFYSVSPGESSATIGGNLATNAGGMKAVRYGVTRHNVLGLLAVLGTGEVLATGGKYVKCSSGYDLTQLLVGSEGTLCLFVQATVKLVPRLAETSTMLAAFSELDDVAKAVPALVGLGVEMVVLEYFDPLVLAATVQACGLELSIAPEVSAKAGAFLMVVLQGRDRDLLERDLQVVGNALEDCGAMESYVIEGKHAAELVSARERIFWVAKAAGANDLVDTVVPRARMPRFLLDVRRLAEESGSLVSACGHVGDGNVHLSVFQPDPVKRDHLVTAITAAGLALGGSISGEHGIGRAKEALWEEFTDPVVRRLSASLKTVFDPGGILNPGVLGSAGEARRTARNAPVRDQLPGDQLPRDENPGDGLEQ